MSGPRHNWNEESIRRIAAVDTANGCSQTIRICNDCRLQKVTMHPPQGFPWLEFVLPGTKNLVKLPKTPSCLRKAPEEVKAS